MTVTLLASTPCLLCGYQTTILMVGTARINKRSMRVQGPLIGAYRFADCPECGTGVHSSSAPRSAYRLHPDDDAAVRAYRMRRWGIDQGTGPLAEKVPA